LNRAVRKHPLHDWIQNTHGVGEKQGARLLAAIGDPAWNSAEGRPRRGPEELYAYCGYVPGQERRRGVKSNWNATAKTRTYLCAEKAVQNGVRKLNAGDDSNGYDVAGRKAISPLGEKYLEARAHYADALHDEPCARCGPKGKPAPAGSPLSDGHKHARALRIVAKQILKDLWRGARGPRPTTCPRPPMKRQPINTRPGQTFRRHSHEPSR
jgi:hypothetical protein